MSLYFFLDVRAAALNSTVTKKIRMYLCRYYSAAKTRTGS